jgi:BolA family transcriptional regulator, general stress-responsive regulator
MGPVQSQIHSILHIQFDPDFLEVINESHMHAGHEHMGPETHFRIRLASFKFSGKKTIERHRLVHGALDELLRDKVHAITLDLQTPDEWVSKSSK